MRAWAALGIALAMAGPAQAERVVATLSSQTVEINSSFSGETLSFFGAIEPDREQNGGAAAGPYHVIIVVEGPLTDRVAREKTNVAGIWINTDQVTFSHFPSFFHVLSSGRLNDITDVVTLTIEDILPEIQAEQSAEAGWYKSAVFGSQLVRLMTERGLFGVNTQGVQFLSDTAYSGRLTLPSNIANGSFIAHTYVFREGTIVARETQGFTVRKSGFERFVGLAALQQPVLYGLACVLLALGTGWLGGVVFRR